MPHLPRITIQIEYVTNGDTFVSFWEGPLFLRSASRSFESRMKADIYAADTATMLQDMALAKCDFRTFNFQN